MLMQNFGGQTKNIMVFLKVAKRHLTYIPTLPAAHKHLNVINTTNTVIKYTYGPCDNDWLLVLRSLSVAYKSVIPLTPFVAPFPPPIDGFHSRELTAIFGVQNNRKYLRRICIKVEFSPQGRGYLLF